MAKGRWMLRENKVRLAVALAVSCALPLAACGGGSSGSPAPAPTPAPTPAPSPTPSPTPTQAPGTFQATGGACDGTAGWLAVADDGLDDTDAIRTSFQQAADKGDTLTIPAGTYNINGASGVTAFLRNQDFAIIATGAIFVAGPDMNADLIAFDASSTSFSSTCGGDAIIDFSWTGGELDITQAPLSGTVPLGGSVGATRPGSPVASTTDGLSVRAATGGSSPRQKGGAITIREITIVAAPISQADRVAVFENVDTADPIDRVSDTYRNAGGDSGVFVMGAQSALIENSTFYGIRDASIYMSAAPFNPTFGANYVLRNNRFYGGFDGISSKRGAQDIRMENNVFVNIARGMSLESLAGPLRDTNSQTQERIVQPVVMTGNLFNGVQRSIQVESANDVTVSNNVIRNMGARVAQQNGPVRYGRYEGIVLEGVTNATIADNTIEGVTGARSTASDTVGITVSAHPGIVGPIMSSNVTIAASNAFSNLDSNSE